MKDVVKFEEANETNDSNSLKWIGNLSLTIQNLGDLINDENFKTNLLCSHINYQKSVSLRLSLTVRKEYFKYKHYSFIYITVF